MQKLTATRVADRGDQNLATIYIHLEACPSCQEVLIRSNGKAADRVYRHAVDLVLDYPDVHRAIYYGHELPGNTPAEDYNAEEGY